MKIIKYLFFGIITIGANGCQENKNALELLQCTIDAIDTIETIYYKQDLQRNNPRNLNDTIFRYREMHFTRLKSDSIVGVKGHWFMYVHDREEVVYEDIYDGHRLIRKNNRDSVARIYDLEKYPDFKNQHFWSHNTPFGMQYEFKHVLANADEYTTSRLKDTTINGQDSYQIMIGLKDKTTMPGFATHLVDEKGSLSQSFYFINKKNYNLVGMKGESSSMENPESKVFIEQKYYDVQINQVMDEEELFNTTESSMAGFEIKEMKPN